MQWSDDTTLPSGKADRQVASMLPEDRFGDAARERFWRRPSRPRFRACSAAMPTSSPMMAAGRLVRHGHLPEREIMTSIGPVAVRCPHVRDRDGEGSERIRFSSAILPPCARAGRRASKC